ncbi:MAG: 6,7-dimethyl-8-ribityllumazine synthase [Verrucomicrobium sp.]|nr:6,7-dimethyl-8-ribityllumazine synthase [Verrucomicrobium sp.]
MKFAAVVSTYHREYTESLYRSAKKIIEGKGHSLDVVWVPGSFEIPLAVQRLARKKPRYAAIMAFGIVWEGKTRHAGEIIRACTDSLMRIMLENDIPILHEVLSIHTESEVRARTMGRLNRGVEAAEAALAMTGQPKK